MAKWKFFDYVDTYGENRIESWYQLQDAEVRAAFDATLLILRAISDWTDPTVKEFKVLDGEDIGLGEIRFHVVVQPKGARTTRRRRFRPVGPWPPDYFDFVMVLGCEKAGNVYDPPKAFALARTLAADWKEGKGSIREHN